MFTEGSLNLYGSPLQDSFLKVLGKFMTIFGEGITTITRESTPRKYDNLCWYLNKTNSLNNKFLQFLAVFIESKKIYIHISKELINRVLT